MKAWGGAAPTPRLRLALAPALAGLWLLTCAPADTAGQTLTANPPPVKAGVVATTTTDSPVVSPSPQASPPQGRKVLPETIEPEALGSEPGSPPEAPSPAPQEPDEAPARVEHKQSDHWKRAAEQSLLFLGVQHGYAFTQPKTRRDLSGPFFRDYFHSVKSLGGWEDGGKFFTNYVAHPMQGSLLGFVWVQNDPKGKSAPFGRSKAYWRSRAKALTWSAAWSTQFEIGPVSQASIGNVGLHGKQTWVDIVVTPAGGAVWLVSEDALDRFVVRRIERRFENRFLRIAVRMLFNPTRSSANLLRFERPWRRDR